MNEIYIVLISVLSIVITFAALITIIVIVGKTPTIGKTEVYRKSNRSTVYLNIENQLINKENKLTHIKKRRIDKENIKKKKSTTPAKKSALI